MSRSAHSGAAVASGTLPVERLERLWGWGRTSSATSYVYRPSTPEGVLQMFELARAHGVTVGLRGAGQSYGDAALNAGNICLDLSCMKRILAWDPGQGIIQLEPGVTIEQLWQHAIEDGWWPAVVPGTMFATLGGCLGMNVHGKNNWAVRSANTSSSSTSCCRTGKCGGAAASTRPSSSTPRSGDSACSGAS